MWDKMTCEAREENTPYFQAYHDSVAKIGVPSRKPGHQVPTSLLLGLEEAVLTAKPHPQYLLTPTLKSKLKLILLSHLPLGVAERILACDYKQRMNEVLNV